MPGKAIGSGSSKKATLRSNKAWLQFPIGRIAILLKVGKNQEQVGVGVPIYLVVVQYLVAEVLELVGKVARDNKKSIVVPRHIYLAVQNDEELSKLFGAFIIANLASLGFLLVTLLHFTQFCFFTSILLPF